MDRNISGKEDIRDGGLKLYLEEHQLQLDKNWKILYRSELERYYQRGRGGGLGTKTGIDEF